MKTPSIHAFPLLQTRKQINIHKIEKNVCTTEIWSVWVIYEHMLSLSPMLETTC